MSSVQLFRTGQLPGRTVKTADGKEYLYFSGTDYLGMGHNSGFQKYLNEGIAMYGTHYGSSRNNSLQLNVYEEVEDRLARFAAAPASLTVSSGMWAGQLVMKMIESIVSFGEKVKYHYAPCVHPALWGNQYSTTRGSWVVWAKDVVRSISETPVGVSHIVCTDAIGSPWAEEFDFTVFHHLPKDRSVYLIADDSHNLGVRGTNGNGIFETLNTTINAEIIVVSSLNKALGIPAGVIFGDQRCVNILRNSPWFAGASPPPPAYMHALKLLLEDGCIVEANIALHNNIDYFSKKLRGQTLFASIAGYPVLCRRETPLFDHLLGNGIMASCFSYPSPSDLPVTRIALNALHQKKDLDRLAEVCMAF